MKRYHILLSLLIVGAILFTQTPALVRADGDTPADPPSQGQEDPEGDPEGNPSTTPDPEGDPSTTPDPEGDPSTTPDPEGDPSNTPDPNDPSNTPDPSNNPTDDPTNTPDPTPDPTIPATMPEINEVGYASIKEFIFAPTGAAGEAWELQLLFDEAITVDDDTLVIIRIPAGTYTISTPMRIYSNTCLYLEDGAVLLHDGDTGAMLIDSDDNGEQASVGGYDLAKNIFIYGGKFQGSAATTKNVNDFVRINHCTNLIVRNVDFSGSIGHLLNISGCCDVLVDGCTFSGNVIFNETSGDAANEFYKGAAYSEELKISRHRAVEAIHIDFMTAEGENNAFLLDETVPKNVTVKNCSFTDVLRGIGTHHTNSTKAENITIESNTFLNVKTACVSAYSYSNLTVKNNTCTNSGCFIQTDDVSDLTISGNTISGMISDSDPINHIILPLYIINVSNVTIENNKIDAKDPNATSVRAYPLCLRLENVTTATVKGNTFSNSLNNAVYVLNCTGITFNNESTSKKNTYSTIESGKNPISINSSTATVGYETLNGDFYCKDSTVSVLNNTIKGRVIFENAPSINIEGNTITSDGVQCLTLSGLAGPVTVKNNTLTAKNTDNTIYINNKDKKITISGNTFKSGPSKNYIYMLDSNSVTVENNKMNASGSPQVNQAFSINNSTATISKNTISGMKAAAIYINDKSKVTISDNTITGYAVNMKAGTEATITDNTFKSAGDMAIYMNGIKKTTITGNKFSSSPKGIQAHDSANLIIKNNTFDCSNKGILLFNSKDTNVATNTFSGEYKTWTYRDNDCTNVVTPTPPASGNTTTPKPTSTTPKPTSTTPKPTSTTPKPTSTTPSPTTTTAPAEEQSFGGFVERLYNVALGRDSEAEGKAFWVKNVGEGNLTGADAAREFLNSAEFKGKGLSDEQFLAVLYKTFFNRDYKDDPDGFNFWMNSLKSVGRDKVVDGFINSTEWCNICAEYGIRSGATTAKATIASKNAIAFAERLYTCCLGREAEEEGLNFWSLALTNQETSGTEAARLFFESAEFKGFNTSNEEYIKRLYTTFMGREYDDGGLNYWLGEMKNGMTREEVFTGFASSKEFTEICKSYGIQR